MEDVYLLKQKIEFLLFELEEAKNRETQMKSMYDSMLKSYSEDSPILISSPSVESKELQEKHLQETIALKQKHKEKKKKLKSNLKDLNEINESLKEKLNNEEGIFERSKTLLEKEVQIAKEGKKESEKRLTENIEELEYTLAKKTELIAKLRFEIECLKKANAEEINRITEETNKSILELKAIYDREKPRKTLKENETYESLKNEFQDLQVIIKNLESSEEILKLQLQAKEEHIEKLSRKLRIKASEDSKNTEEKNLAKIKENLTEKLIDKEIEISKLKKIIGELKLEAQFGVSKPPIHSPKTNRSLTFINKADCPSPEPLIFEKQEEYKQLKQYERMIIQSSAIECDSCYRLYPTSSFYEHLLNCRFDESFAKSNSFLNSVSSEKIQELEKNNETLKLGLAKLKNQRDKAKIECEKLLMQLKQTKLEWALSEETYDEKLMDFKKSLKNCLEILIRIKRHVSLTDDLTFEIELAVQNNDKFFGGRLSKSFSTPN